MLPNHTSGGGGVSVNSLCQQGGLFALSVNRHSIIFNVLVINLVIYKFYLIVLILGGCCKCKQKKFKITLYFKVSLLHVLHVLTIIITKNDA